MNSYVDRQMFSHLVVILGACVGAWMWQVQPRMRQLTDLNRRVQENQSAKSAFTADAVDMAVKRLDFAKLRLVDIEASNALATDSSRFYGLVMDLADANHVLIKSLQPRSGQLAPADAKVLVTRIDLSIEGQYSDVAKFLSDVSDLPVYTTPVSLQLTPTVVGRKTLVTANFTCGILQFPIPESLATLAGVNDGHP